MKKTEIDPHECPVLDALDVFAGKWKVCILFALKEGPVRFNDLRRMLPDISQKMLTQQLRLLEENGLVLRKQYREVPPRVEYSLTKLADTINPVLKLMVEWSRKNMKDIEKARKNYKRKKNKLEP